MSKYNKSNRFDEKALAVLSDFFSDQYGDYFDLQFHGIKDNTPDTDGFLRLRKPTEDKELEGGYLNKVVFFQLKGQGKSIKERCYTCKTNVVKFCLEINIPIILFVVGGLDRKANLNREPEIYWYYFNNINSNRLLDSLKKKPDQTTIKIYDLELLKGAENNRWKVLYDDIHVLAKKDSFKDLPEPALNLLNIYKDNLNKVAGSIYLLGTLNKNDISALVKILQIQKQDINKILTSLENKGLVYLKSDLIFFKEIKDERNIYIGSLFLREILNEVDIQQMLDLFPKKIKNILISISTIYHPSIKAILENYAESQFINNDDILEKLELLKVYIFRIPDRCILIIKDINKTLDKDVGVRLKLIELLEVLMLYRVKTKEVFALLLYFSNSGDNIIKENAQKVLSMLAEYNLSALQGIYLQQTVILDEISRFNNKKLYKNNGSISIVLKKILEPSYKGSLMENYKTWKIYQGALKTNKKLSDIRYTAITILKKLFELSTTNIQKIEIIDTLRKATELPYDTYTEELKELVINNTNAIIAYYITIIDNSDNEIIQVIDEQVYFLTKIFSQEPLINIQELQAKITQKKEYSIYNILTGVEYFDENLDWEDVEKQRKQKIKELIDDIDETNFDTWQERIIAILDIHEKGNNDSSKYYYFRFLLKEVGQYKPEIAKRLIDNNEQKLEYFLLDIISGIWLSTNKSTVSKLITNFINQGKHLSICTYIFAEIKEIDVDLLQMGFEKAKEKEDVEALVNIIRSIVVNYPEDNRHTRLFIETVKSLTKLKSSTWGIWCQDKLFWEKFSERQFNLILKNLELAHDIDYHVETILEIIFNKYPSKILPFLKNRINKRSVNRDFKAIPYEFYKLLSVFRDNKQQIIPEILKWFDDKKEIFSWEARKILTNTYTLDILDQFLVELLDTEQEQNIKTVWAILGGYIGKITLDIRIVQKLIREYPDIHNDLMYFMSNTDDVVVGEYGFVNDLISKKEDIQKWKKDKRKYIQKFVNQYEEYLDKQIDYEKKKANEDIVLMENNKY